MTEELTLAARILLDAQNYVRGLTKVKTETREAAAEIGESFKRAGEGMLRSLGVELAALKVGMEVFDQFKESAARDKSMMRLGQAAKLTSGELSGVRKQLWAMSRETGTEMDELVTSLNDLVGNGMRDMKEALPTLDAINKTMAVTGSSSETLAASLEVASKQFDFDLSKPQQALRIMDQLAAASGGGHGYGTVDEISGALSNKVGENAHTAGLSFKETLAFLGEMAKNDPQHLALNANALLQSFQVAKRMEQIEKTTGLHMFKKHGARADVLDVLVEAKKHYDEKKTDRAREGYLEKLLKGTPLKSVAGVRALFQGDNIAEMVRSSKTDDSGFVSSRESGALDNMADQGPRLKATMDALVDKYAQPINKELAHGMEYLLDAKNKGGLDLSGGKILEGVAGLGAGGWIAKKLGGGLLSKLVSQPEEVLKAKVLEKVAGVTPVFVTNWPGSSPGTGPSGPVDEVEKHALDVAGGAALGNAKKAFRLLPFLGRLGAGVGAFAQLMMTSGDSRNHASLSEAEKVRAKQFRGDESNAYAAAHGYQSGDAMVAAVLAQSARLDRQHAADAQAKAVGDALKHWDVRKDGTPAQKALLQIQIDAQGNAKLVGMNPGSSFSDIETTIRNSPVGRMMTSL